MEYSILINDGEKVFSPTVADGVEWSTARRGSAGKLAFSIMRDEAFIPSEGAGVTFCVDGRTVFCGYVFSRRWTSEGVISVVAYDQLRYFKNRDTYVYSGKSASQIVKMIAGDFGLVCGDIADTKYVIPSRVEDNETLFDIVGNALDITFQNTGEMYVLYDDCGNITLKSIKDMAVRDGDKYLMLDEDVMGDFEFSSSIDNTFNQIKLTRENKKSGRREVFTAKDEANIKAWGVLQHFGKVTGDENGKAKAQSLLKLYNAKSRGLKLKNVLGDLRVRGGVTVGVSLTSGGVKKSEFMLVESVSHFFKENEHLMNLTLCGGDENG